MKKDILKTFIFTAVPYGIIMGLVNSKLKGSHYGIISGIISGLLFGIGVTVFLQIIKKKFKGNRLPLTNTIEVIMEGGGNHFKGIEAVGGWIYLTSEHIIFKSHAFNVQKHEIIIPLNQIVNAKATFTLGFIPNGLKIIKNDGIVEKFVVDNRKTWAKKINDAIYLYK